MFVDVKKHVDFLIEAKMSPEEFLFCYLLYSENKNPYPGRPIYLTSADAMSSLYKYVSIRPWSKVMIDSLVQRGWIIEQPKYKGEKYRPEYYETSGKFIDKVFGPSNRFEEFWDTYPSFVDNFQRMGGPKVRLKTITIDEATKLYHKMVPNRATHVRMMDALRWAVANKRVSMGLEKWLGSKQWEADILERGTITVQATENPHGRLMNNSGDNLL
jgi:hypothetical protein